MENNYDRDFFGYGARPPQAHWPDEAKIAVQFVINYEEGGENCILHGDPASEAFLSEIVGAQPWPGQRHMNMESVYEYGGRAGFWRLKRLFDRYELPVTVFAVAMAMQRNPDAVEAMLDSGWEIASHGYKWVDYAQISEEIEREHLYKALEIHTRLTGKEPSGWYIGRTSSASRRLLLDMVQPLYDSDSYADDLPYWLHGMTPNPHLVVPYTLDVNDMRFATAQGFHTSEQFFQYLKDSFDVLYEEGAEAPKMLSIGLHCRLVGRPGRLAGLKRFIEYILSKPKVWVCTREQIAQHWHLFHYPELENAQTDLLKSG
ncbi:MULTISPECIES: allantoinase PuuE [Thiomicrorhabdus]|uniref:Allantoinase PuuE n=1 Tax=Thiomicrorhabdus heinhorstiae TaxID=2748010 RepID=A0ABS0BXG4_9GAMM|nr:MULTISPECIES: allantoinase PuuE [Thiomicrorhabdus]MBF6058488.1 allantoinase PuuE [Thiomicrorhabdus heinhorstiae]